MEFIPELPISEGYNNVLVVRDKLVIYANFVLISISITRKGTVIAKSRILRQEIVDKDSRRRGRFRKEVSNRTSLK